MGLPGRVMFKHRVEDSQQLTHAGGKGHFLRFTCCYEPFIEGTEDRIVAHGYQGGHVKGGADIGPPSPTATLSAQLAAISAEGRYTHQRGNLSAVQGAQLRKASQEREGQRGSNSWHTLEQVFLLTPQGALAQAVRDIPVQVFKLLVQRSKNTVDAMSNHWECTVAALLLGHLHLDKLSAPCHQGFQFSGLGFCQRLRADTAGLREVGNSSGVQAVGPFGYTQDRLWGEKSFVRASKQLWEHYVVELDPSSIRQVVEHQAQRAEELVNSQHQGAIQSYEHQQRRREGEPWLVVESAGSACPTAASSTGTTTASSYATPTGAACRSTSRTTTTWTPSSTCKPPRD